MMREADFAALLHPVERLSLEQRTALGRALAAASGESEAIRLLEGAFLAAPRCPHCAATALQRWGYASGLRRYRCTACHKTFNALTGTSLARLRKKECWLAYGEALAAGMTLVQAAARCGVHQLPLAAPLPRGADGDAGGADRRGRGRRDLFSRLAQRVPTMAPSRRAPRATSPPAGRARAFGGAGPGLDRPCPRRPHRRCRAARSRSGGHR